MEEPEISPNPRACGRPLEDHVDLALAALTMFGMAVACETEYQAMLVIAEAARRIHGHAAYDPAPEAEALILRARLEREDARQDEIETGDVPLIPGNGIMH